MVLLIGGVKLEESPSDSRSLYHLAPHLKESAAGFAATIPRDVKENMGLLYVSQREFAVSGPHDKNVNIIGTSDCTTCLAVAFRQPNTGAVAFGHFDSLCVDGISSMLNRLQDLNLTVGYFDHNSPLHMHIVGSFSDTRGYGEEIICSLLHYVHKQDIEVELVSACIGELNTIVRGNLPYPIHHGMAMNLKNGELFPANFLEKGPDLPLRNARIYSGTHHLIEIYDYTSGFLKIGPFHYEPLRCANTMLQESDEFILKHLSSSPEVVPPHVVTEIKNTLRHIHEHPFPEITIFPENRPRYYRKNEMGNWHFIRVEAYLSNRFEHLA